MIQTMRSFWKEYDVLPSKSDEQREKLNNAFEIAKEAKDENWLWDVFTNAAHNGYNDLERECLLELSQMGILTEKQIEEILAPNCIS